MKKWVWSLLLIIIMVSRGFADDTANLALSIAIKAKRKAIPAYEQIFNHANIPIVVLGADHAKNFLYGTDGSNGQAGMFFDHGFPYYIGTNTDPSGNTTIGYGNMMTIAQALSLQAKGAKFMSHGVRHIGTWNKIATGILIKYTPPGAQAAATVEITDTGSTEYTPNNIIGYVDGGQVWTYSLTDAATDTILEVVATIDALPDWQAWAAAEITTSDSATKLLSKGQKNVFNVQGGFAAGGGMEITFATSAGAPNAVYWLGTVERRDNEYIYLYSDGVRDPQTGYFSLTNAATDTYAELCTAINNLTRWNCSLSDDTTIVQYIDGTEKSTNLLVTSVPIDATKTPAMMDGGLTRAEMIYRQLQLSKDSLETAGFTVEGFIQSGGQLYPYMIKPFANIYKYIRAFDEPHSLNYPNFGGAGKDPWLWYYNTWDASIHPDDDVYDCERMKAAVQAAEDYGPARLEMMVHTVKAATVGSKYYAQLNSTVTAGYVLEDEMECFLDWLQTEEQAGRVDVLSPAEAVDAAKLRSEAKNLVFNSKFRSSSAVEAITIAKSQRQVPGWMVEPTTPGNATITASNGMRLADGGDIYTRVFLEPGTLYEFGGEIIVNDYTSGKGAHLTIASGYFGQPTDFSTSTTNYIKNVKDSGYVVQKFRTPAKPAPLMQQIVSIVEPFNLSINYNTKLRFMENGNYVIVNASTAAALCTAAGSPWGCCTGAGTGNCGPGNTSAVTAKEVATNINRAFEVDAAYNGAIYGNCASWDDSGRVYFRSYGTVNRGVPYSPDVGNAATFNASATLWGEAISKGQGDQTGVNYSGYYPFILRFSATTMDVELRNPYIKRLD